VLSHRISGWRGVFTKLEYLILNQLRQHRRPPINFRSGAGGKKSKVLLRNSNWIVGRKKNLEIFSTYDGALRRGGQRPGHLVGFYPSP
jgi:hypothetical protein